MNLPNKLTLLRVILIPFFALFLLWQFTKFNIFIALAIFAAASLTDLFDGKIARKYNLVTDFGKFLDPLADKALVMAALVGFIELGWCGSVPVMIILFREFMVSALRLVVKSGSGVVVPAGWLGKIKTSFTMVSLILVMLLRGIEAVGVAVPYIYRISAALIWISAVLTAVSGAQYLKAYWKVIDPSK